MANAVVPADALDEEAERLAEKICENSLISLRAVKMLINYGLTEGCEAD